MSAYSNLENRVRTVRRGEKTIDNQSVLEEYEENKSCNNSQLQSMNKSQNQDLS